MTHRNNFTVKRALLMTHRNKLQCQEKSSVQRPKASLDCSSPMLIRHSPADIAVLRCAPAVFFNSEDRIAIQELKKMLKNNKSSEVEIIRRLRPGEIDGSYDEPWPLLCREILRNPYGKEKGVLKPYLNRYSNFKNGVWLRVKAGKEVFRVHVFPAKKHNQSGESVRQSFFSNKVICGWRVYEDPIVKTESPVGGVDISKKNKLEAICKADLPSLKNLASYAFVRQYGNDLDRFFGLIPSSLIADLKGR